MFGKDVYSRPGRRPSRGLVLSLLLGLLFTAACQTGPVYKPRGPNDSVGYTDQQLTANRYRVTFTGTSSTKRVEVENYLLRRAAEVTLAAGYTHFAFDTRNTEAKTYFRQTFDSWPDRYFGYYGGYGPYFGPGAWYWSAWPPYGPYPPGAFFDNEIRPVTSYSAYSEIVMLTDEQAADNSAAISARELLDRLVPPPPPAATNSTQRRG